MKDILNKKQAPLPKSGKVIVEPEPPVQVEIEHKIRLTSKEKELLQKVRSSNGNRIKRGWDSSYQRLVDLKLLDLTKPQGSEAREIALKIKDLWKVAAAAVRDQARRDTSKAMDDIQEQEHLLEQDYYRLTAAGEEYFLKGKVTVTL